MAAGNVKGITVEIGGDTTKLGKALESSEKQSRDLQKELKQVNTALKFNPDNVELLTQKQKILTDQIQATKEKLDTLKEAEAQVTAQFKAGEIGEEQFREFQREIVETESKLKTYQGQLEETGKQASSLDELTNSISDQEKKIEDLKTEWKNAVLTYGEGSDEANALAKEIDELSSELQDNKSKMSELDKAADKLDNSLEEVEESTDDASGGFTVMKGALADLVSKGIQTAISALKDLASSALDAYKDFDEGQDNVIKATGATGEAAEALSESYKKVAKSVVGDMSTIGSALGEVNTRFGWTGEKLESATTQFMKFSDITGVDAVSAVQLVSRAMEGAGVNSEEYATVLDQLAVAGQASGTSVEKLAENLTKFGTPMREMGLSTSESIAMLAQFEKAGINTESALGGMRKALQNWSKDGKVASKEFGKVVQQIKDAPNSTKATEIAMENFGNKAGPELAEAIQSGRFEWEDFIELIEGSSGAVTNTYEETQDGFDKINLAIQGARAELGDFVGRLLTQYQPQIEEAINAGVELFQNATKWVIENFDEIKKACEIIIPVIAGVFAVNKISTFISSINTLKGAFTALWGVMAGNPITLVVAALGGLTAGLIALKEKQDEAIKSEYGLSEAQEKSISASKQLKSEYDSLAEARSNALGAIDAEFGYLGELTDEYNDLIDSNGKVKEGYEDRANFIINQLAEALGVERDEILKNVDANGKLGDSIDQLIVKKQAEATLAATEDAYTKAIQNRNEALDTYMSAQKTYNEAEKKYQDSVTASGNVLDEYNRLLRESPGYADDYYWANQTVIKGQEEAKAAMEEAKGALSDAESAYVGYTSTIQNYEGLSAAIISGDTEKIRIALENSQTNFVTAETGTRDTLERQLQNFRDNYELMKEAVEQGMPNVTQAQVDAAKEMVEKAEAELNKLPGEAKKSGKKSGNEHAAGVTSTVDANKKAAKKVAADTNKEFGSENTKATGKKKGDEHAEGVASTAGANKKAAEVVSKSTNTGLDSADDKGTGKKKGNEYASGVKSTSGAATAAGKVLSQSANKGEGSVDHSKTGQKNASQYVSGVTSKKGEAQSGGKSLATSANSGAGSVSGYGSGQNFGQGFINGIGSKIAGAISKAAELARAALNAVRNTTKEGSPSKITTASGGFFGQGFINGIRGKIKDAAKAARDMANAALGELDTGDFSDVGLTPDFNPATFGRQLDNTFTAGSQTVDFTSILDRLDALETSIRNMRSVIVLDSGVLVGETINQIDSGLADVYGLKARGI